MQLSTLKKFRVAEGLEESQKKKMGKRNRNILSPIPNQQKRCPINGVPVPMH